MARSLAPYRTYIIRSWEEPCRGSQSGAAIYRFTLDIPATRQRFGFTSLRELINALELALSQIQIQTIADTTPEDESDQTF